VNRNTGIGLAVVGIILGIVALIQHTAGLFHVLHLAVYLGVVGVIALVAGVAMVVMAGNKS
jgi:hypothetical protein